MMSMFTQSRWLRLLSVVAALALVLGCEEDNADSGSSSSSSSSTTDPDGSSTSLSSITAGAWTATFQGRTITLRFSEGNGTDSSGYRIDSVSGTLWSGQQFSGGRYFLGSDAEGRTTIGITVPADSSLASGLGTFLDDNHLNLGWSDSTYGGYCGQLLFTKQ